MSAPAPLPRSGSALLTNLRLVDGDGSRPQEDLALVIDDGVIAAVASAESVRREGTIDLGGAFVMPGDPTAEVGAPRGLDFVMRDGVVVRDDRGRTAARS